ncbi:MAG: nitrous oxide reductase accessory protein NosL [Polyangia bacterium]
MRALVAAALLMLAAGCHQGAEQPLDPVWGKQPCDHCAMLVDEPRFAAQVATDDGQRLYFDDAGCMGGWLREHAATHARAWVQRDSRWVSVDATLFQTGARTPMGYGFVAAAEGLPWPEVQRRLAARDAVTEAFHAQ